MPAAKSSGWAWLVMFAFQETCPSLEGGASTSHMDGNLYSGVQIGKLLKYCQATPYLTHVAAWLVYIRAA